MMISVCGKIKFQKGNYVLKLIHKGSHQQKVLEEANIPPYQCEGDGKTTNWRFINNVYKKSASLKIPGNIHVDSLVVKDARKAK